MTKEDKYIKPYNNYVNDKGVWVIEFIKEDLIEFLKE